MKMMKTEGEALAYIVDCTLATVADMAMKKSRKKGEYNRQKSIAAKGVQWLVEFKVPDLPDRVQDILENHEGSVEKWAETYEV